MTEKYIGDITEVLFVSFYMRLRNYFPTPYVKFKRDGGTYNAKPGFSQH